MLLREMVAVTASTRSPLRYPGGKSRAVEIVARFIPEQERRLCSPFMGGGSVELALASKGITVHGYDAFRPLVNFWRHLLRDADSLADEASLHYPLSRSRFYELQSELQSEQSNVSGLQSAAMFFVLNRASFSGTTLSGGMSPGHPRFTVSALDRLRSFRSPNISVNVADFADSIQAHKDDFLYCDPPYLIDQKLYGSRGDMHSSFDHERLSDLLKSRDRWVLSYNDSQAVRKLYSGLKVISVEWAYGMNNSRRPSCEIIILSKDLS